MDDWPQVSKALNRADEMAKATGMPIVVYRRSGRVAALELSAYRAAKLAERGAVRIATIGSNAASGYKRTLI